MRRQITVTMDRPKGARHPKHSEIIYPINYGYVEGIMGGDGEEQDVYLLGVDEPVSVYENAWVIAVIHRNDDVEEKWVACPMGMQFTKEEIEEQVEFQEKYHDSYVTMLD